MNDPIADLYRSHHRALCTRHTDALSRCGYDHLIVYSGRPHSQFLDDNLCAFKANPHFKTWVPLPQHAGGAIVVSPDQKPRLVYLQPEDYWHSPPVDPEGYWPALFDLRTARNDGQVVTALSDLNGRIAVIGDHTMPDEIGLLGELNPADLLNLLHFGRAEKTAYEVECMRRANALAVRGHRAAERSFRDGASEFEIHLAYCQACGQTPDELPYGSIVALNGAGAVLHYGDYRQEKKPPESFLIDAGADYNGYAADITRTYSAANDHFAALIEDVDQAQLVICDQAVAGVDYVDLHISTHRLVADVLIRHDVLTCSADAAVEQGITSTFLPHGLGHLIGAQVHDVGGHQATPTGELREPPENHPFLRLTRVLQPGMVCTIEPGIYFIPMLLKKLRDTDAGKQVSWSRVEDFLPFGGVRIEDDIHITPNGHENLTRTEFARISHGAGH